MGKVDGCCAGECHQGEMAREAASIQWYFKVTESEAAELKERARLESGGVMSAVVRRALGLPVTEMGRIPRCRCSGKCGRPSPCRR